MTFQEIFNGNIYLYVRVSSNTQSASRQIKGGLEWFKGRGVHEKDITLVSEKISTVCKLQDRKIWDLLTGKIDKDGKIKNELEGSNENRRDFIYLEDLSRNTRADELDGMICMAHTVNNLETTLFFEKDRACITGADLPEEVEQYVGRIQEQRNEILRLSFTSLFLSHQYTMQRDKALEGIRLRKEDGYASGGITGKLLTKPKMIRDIVDLHNNHNLTQTDIARMKGISWLTVKKIMCILTGTTKESHVSERKRKITQEDIDKFFKNQAKLVHPKRKRK